MVISMCIDSQLTHFLTIISYFNIFHPGQVLAQPAVQIQRVQQPHNQTVQVNAVNTTTSSNTITLPIVQDTSQTHDHNVDHSSGSQGNNL